MRLDWSSTQIAPGDWWQLPAVYTDMDVPVSIAGLEAGSTYSLKVAVVSSGVESEAITMRTAAAGASSCLPQATLDYI